MSTAKSKFFQVGMQGDVVGEFFGELHKKFDTKNKNIEIQNFKNRDTRISLLVIDNRTAGFVIEKRTEFNDLEFIYGEVEKENK